MVIGDPVVGGRDAPVRGMAVMDAMAVMAAVAADAALHRRTVGRAGGRGHPA